MKREATGKRKVFDRAWRRHCVTWVLLSMDTKSGKGMYPAFLHAFEIGVKYGKSERKGDK